MDNNKDLKIFDICFFLIGKTFCFDLILFYLQK